MPRSFPRRLALARLDRVRVIPAVTNCWCRRAEHTSRKGTKKRGGVKSRKGTHPRNLMRVPIGENMNVRPIAASLLNSFGNEVAQSVIFGDCFTHLHGSRFPLSV